jgi:hypothetical protein
MHHDRHRRSLPCSVAPLSAHTDHYDGDSSHPEEHVTCSASFVETPLSLSVSEDRPVAHADPIPCSWNLLEHPDRAAMRSDLKSCTPSEAQHRHWLLSAETLDHLPHVPTGGGLVTHASTRGYGCSGAGEQDGLGLGDLSDSPVIVVEQVRLHHGRHECSPPDSLSVTMLPDDVPAVTESGHGRHCSISQARPQQPARADPGSRLAVFEFSAGPGRASPGRPHSGRRPGVPPAAPQGRAYRNRRTVRTVRSQAC